MILVFSLAFAIFLDRFERSDRSESIIRTQIGGGAKQFDYIKSVWPRQSCNRVGSVVILVNGVQSTVNFSRAFFKREEPNLSRWYSERPEIKTPQSSWISRPLSSSKAHSQCQLYVPRSATAQKRIPGAHVGGRRDRQKAYSSPGGVDSIGQKIHAEVRP